MTCRLNKYLAWAGVTSRRAADFLIQDGRVAINGQIVTKLGVVIDENVDKVELDGKTVKPSKQFIYIMLHKPIGYLVTCKDDFKRPIVLDMLGEFGKLVRPVGRLDLDSSGLLLLTNDGELAFRLSHPRYKIDKTYVVKCEGKVTNDAIQKLKNGIQLEEGKTSPAKAKLISRSDNFTTFEITIHEGRKRQIRRMCWHIGHVVISLKRITIDGLSLGELKEGSFRHLKKSELNFLRKAVCLEEK